MVSDEGFEGVNSVERKQPDTERAFSIHEEDGWEISWLAGSWYINNSTANQSAYRCETTGTGQPCDGMGRREPASPIVAGDCLCSVGFVWDSAESVCTDVLPSGLHSVEFRMTGVSEVHIGTTFRRGLSENASIYSFHPDDLNHSAVLVQGGLGMVILDDSDIVRVSGYNWSVVNGSGYRKTIFGDTVVSVYPDRTVVQCAGDGCEGTSVTCAELADEAVPRAIWGYC